MLLYLMIMFNVFNITVVALGVLVVRILFAFKYEFVLRFLFKSVSKKGTSPTVVGLIVKKKSSLYSRAYIILLCSCAIYYLIDLLFIESVYNVLPLYIVSFAIVCLLLSQNILEFRVKKSFYGYNPHEAKEMISFILSHSKKSDFSDSDGLKNIYSEAEMEETYERINELLPEAAK